MSLRPTPIDGLKTHYIKGSNFKFCVNITEKPLFLLENKNQRWRTSYYYGVYGKGKLFDNNNPSNFENIKPKKITNVERFIDCEEVMYEAEEPCELIGFNSEYKNDRWEAELIDKNLSSIICNQLSVIICFNGYMSINNKQFQKYNFSYLQKDMEYQLKLNDHSEVGLFKLIT